MIYIYIFMFSQRSIMIGFIISIVACLVMYGCSSTSIKEGISNFGGNSAYYTSAKTGEGVKELFYDLAKSIVKMKMSQKRMELNIG